MANGSEGAVKVSERTSGHAWVAGVRGLSVCAWCGLATAKAAGSRPLEDCKAQRIPSEIEGLVAKFRENAKWSSGTGASAWLSAAYLLEDIIGGPSNGVAR